MLALSLSKASSIIVSGYPTALGISLAVGRLTLDQVALVRIQDPQPFPQAFLAGVLASRPTATPT